MRKHIDFDILHKRKPVAFLGTSQKVLERLLPDVRDHALNELQRLQDGRDPRHWKPMPGIGPGVREIRIRVRTQLRIIYITTLPEAIYVLHVFEKKTQRTAGSDIELARVRLRALLRERRNG